MVVNALSLDSILSSGSATASYTMNNLPGGKPGSPFPRAIYGIDPNAWSSTTPGTAASVIPHLADLSTSDDSHADLDMVLLAP
jgi:hypothetical protein